VAGAFRQSRANGSYAELARRIGAPKQFEPSPARVRPQASWAIVSQVVSQRFAVGLRRGCGAQAGLLDREAAVVEVRNGCVRAIRAQDAPSRGRPLAFRRCGTDENDPAGTSDIAADRPGHCLSVTSWRSPKGGGSRKPRIIHDPATKTLLNKRGQQGVEVRRRLTSGAPSR